MCSGLSPDPAAGVFETMLVVDGRPVELDAHLGRMRASAGELFAAGLPVGAGELARERARPLALGRLRLTVTPAAEGELALDVATAAVQRADLFPPWERAVELRGFSVPGGLGAHKWADRAGLAALEADLPHGCLALLLDSGAEVLEASRANLFAVEGGVLLTPPADGRILPGVARARAIEIGRSLGLDVREQALSLERALGAAEVFLTGSVRGVEPVRALDEAPLAGPGSVAGRIAAAMEEQWIGRGAASSAAAL